jgi:hypothetical protein
MEDALIEVQPCGNSPKTICFRHLLEKNNFGKEMFESQRADLCAQGMTISPETIIDATLITATGSDKNIEGKRNPQIN